MKLLFIVPHTTHYDSASVRALPTGGTERSATFLGEALTELGATVRNVTTWSALDDADLAWPDVVVTQHADLFPRFAKGVTKVWWCHQATDRPFLREIVRHARLHAHFVVTLSAFHQRNFADELAMESTVIGHGIWHKELVAGVKDPARLVFASVPQRGLAHVAPLFESIRAQEPEATIAVCSSNATWGIPGDDAPFQDVFDELRSMDGVEVLGSLGQPALYAQYARAGVFFYPATYPETFGLAMAEAMAHRCVPIVTNLGALPERWPPTARLIHRTISEIRTNRQRRRYVPSPPDWLEVAERWLSMLS